MDVNFGDRVIDKNGVEAGTVDHIVRDSWSGEMRKFVVRREAVDLFVSPQDIQQATGGVVKLKVSYEELSKE